MIKRLLLLAIIVELGVFWYVHHEKTPVQVQVANFPQRELVLDKKKVPADEPEPAVETAATTDPLTVIKDKYTVEFENLEKETKKKAKDLLARAKEDFVEESTDGIAALQVMSSYYNEFKTLETETDETFEQIYAQLETELEAGGYSKDEAVTFREQYEEKKKKMLKKALDVQGSYE
ncbi:hypothetical protein RGU12_21665 [Fredinandcohnia sp. QZ13]|uniref:hypothetical protein n=1 Tax=Fredinandcohnia sp. QZ13 TaxID=3073144 RepID=UPI00285319D6|nr:hypothetical protein [Fredinandcohnia sp. QZ13]MDR4890109.1 hypothetical protein [Fredinandcohnia sp. QZ13]